MKDTYLRDAFKAINPNDDENVSLGEVWMYIEGARPTAKQRDIMLEKDLKKDMDEQIEDIYNEFKGEDKRVTKESIQRILTAYSIPPNVVSNMLGKIKIDVKGTVSKQEFQKFMMKFLKERILQVEDDINELRAMFYEADLNKSGFLDMDELYNFFRLKLQADITRDELKNLVQKADLDFNGELDIDEFINLMSKNPSDKGTDGSAESTYYRIRKSRKFDLTEFIKFLKKFPSHFQESFSANMFKNKK